MRSVCINSLIPVRTEPSEKAEQSTQLLFGQRYKVEETLEKWVKIVIDDDGYVGYIDRKLVYPMPVEWESLTPVMVRQSLMHVQNKTSSMPFYLPGGSLLFVKNQSIEYPGKLLLEYTQHEEIKRGDIADYAKKFLHAPYLWGGKTIMGIDCSGLTQVAASMAGISLLRDASQQALQGLEVSFIDDAHKGDLAFFDNDEGKIIHVGIILDRMRIIHASGCVKIDRIDHQGIYSDESKRYTHKLRIIKRI